jgi:predicted AAA+ superfamily ATPase
MDSRLQIALERQNPWWFSKRYDVGIHRLSQFPQILTYLDTEEILLLTGARRTGKSTLVYQIIEFLLARGVPKKEILYINLDEPLFISMADDPALISGLVEEYIVSHGNLERLCELPLG